MATINVVSPHRDDAALSICLTLSRLVAAGNKFRVLSCFTRTAWAPQLADGMAIDDVSAFRSREDDAFISLYGSSGEVKGLGFTDGPLRTDWTIKGREAVQKTYGPESELVRKVADALCTHQSGDTVWAVPLAVGHRDHLVSFWAGVVAASHNPILIYEDMPYALQLSANDLAEQVGGLEGRLDRSFTPTCVEGEFSIRRWIEYLSCYASQFSADELSGIAKEISTRGGERTWMDQEAMRILSIAR